MAYGYSYRSDWEALMERYKSVIQQGVDIDVAAGKSAHKAWMEHALLVQGAADFVGLMGQEAESRRLHDLAEQMRTKAYSLHDKSSNAGSTPPAF